MIEVGWGQDNPAYRQLFTNLMFPGATPEQARSFNDLQRMSCSPLQAAHIVRSFSDIDASAYLPRVTCPTLVLHTRGDMCAPFDEGLFLASSIPGARLVPLETRSHVPMPGEPSFDRVIEEIEALRAELVTPAGVAPAVPRPHAPRAADPRAHRARARQPADRRAPRPLGEDGAQSHHRRLRQDRRREPRAGDRRRRARPASPTRRAGSRQNRDTGPGFRRRARVFSAQPGPRPHGPARAGGRIHGVRTARQHRSRVKHHERSRHVHRRHSHDLQSREVLERRQDAERARRALKLHTVFPSTDGAKAVCLWEGESLPAIKQFVEKVTSGVATNEYMAIEASSAVGLPKLKGDAMNDHRRFGRGQGAPAVRMVLGRLRRRGHDPADRGREPVRGPRPARGRARARRRRRQRQRDARGGAAVVRRDVHRLRRRAARCGAPPRGGRGSRRDVPRGRRRGAPLRGRLVRRRRLDLRRDVHARPGAGGARARARLQAGRRSSASRTGRRTASSASSSS